MRATDEPRRPAAARRAHLTSRTGQRSKVKSAGRNVEGSLLPGHYIVKLDRLSGEELPGAIEPDELLVHAHRDNHPLELLVQFAASRLVGLTGSETLVGRGVRGINQLGSWTARTLASLTGSQALEGHTRRLLGVVSRDHVFRFRTPGRAGAAEAKAHIQRLQAQARAALEAQGRTPRLRVLLTGATGFLGKEILAQAAADRHVEQMVCVVRPETRRDPMTGAVIGVRSPRQRGALLLRQLGIHGQAARKFRFVAGDIERPGLGLAAAESARLRRSLTHVIHCAASVSFDSPYASSFRSNVLGCRNALGFSAGLQRAKGSPFVAHVAIETSYIHGRHRHSVAPEDSLHFPPHFYNNFYELTKAMASLETDRALVEQGLRVTQLLPSIVIGHSRTGNNRGDLKVLNAPVNAFGRAKEALDSLAQHPFHERWKAQLVAWLATAFPSDPSAEINLVSVDRVASGVLAALTTPEAIGARIHLATDRRIRSQDIVRVTREELGVNVRMTDPTLSRTLALPLLKSLLVRLGEHKLAGVLERLGAIFGVYGEWGQPIHGVGNDVRILGLPVRRPDTVQSFRMLCRHNKYVQEFGKVRDLDEIARREQVWDEAIDAIEFETGRQAGALSARSFRRALGERIALGSFTPL